MRKTATRRITYQKADPQADSKDLSFRKIIIFDFQKMLKISAPIKKDSTLAKKVRTRSLRDGPNARR